MVLLGEKTVNLVVWLCLSHFIQRQFIITSTQQRKREIPAPSTPYQHLHKGILNYSLIIRESPCGRWVTHTPAANWPINNPPASREEAADRSAGICYQPQPSASTLPQRVAASGHVGTPALPSAGLSAGETPASSCYCCSKLQLLTCCVSIGADRWCHHISWSLSTAAKRGSFLFYIIFFNVCQTLCRAEGCVNAGQSGCQNSPQHQLKRSSGYTHNFIKMRLCDWNCSLICITAITGNIEGNNFDSHFS